MWCDNLCLFFGCFWSEKVASCDGFFLLIYLGKIWQAAPLIHKHVWRTPSPKLRMSKSIERPILFINMHVLILEGLAYMALRYSAYRNAHEDGNGEKLTVKKWWLFGCRFFTVCAEFFTVYKGRKRWKNISLLIWASSRLVFHRLLGLSPSTVGSPDWFQEWFRKIAHRFSQSLFQPYSETT